MRFLTNIYDPEREDAKIMLLTPIGQTRDDAWRIHKQWVSAHVIGEPMPTEYYTAKELKAAGMVGLYADDRGGQS